MEAWCLHEVQTNIISTNANATVTIRMPFSFADTNFHVDITKGRNGHLGICGDTAATGLKEHTLDGFYVTFKNTFTSDIYFTFTLKVIGRWK